MMLSPGFKRSKLLTFTSLGLTFMLFGGLQNLVINSSLTEKELVSFDTEAKPTESCQAVKKIGFLKIHKCASTTLQNIFLRFSLFNELNVVLPAGRWNYLGNPELFSPKMVEKVPWNNLKYDIMTLHTRWNHAAVKEILGGVATFVTAVRDPVSHFESMYSYYKLHELYDNLTITQFIGKIDDENYIKKYRRYAYKIGRNQMMFDLGFNESDFDNEKKIVEFVDEVEKNFDLVMITELFEESIILLKNLLCWEYNDIAYLKLNSRTVSSSSLNETQKAQLKKWLKADVILYERFRKVFDKKLEAFGNKRMEEEKAGLQAANERIIEKCASNSVADLGQMRNRVGCRAYAFQEYDFLEVVKAVQWVRADKAFVLEYGLK